MWYLNKELLLTLFVGFISFAYLFLGKANANDIYFNSPINVLTNTQGALADKSNLFGHNILATSPVQAGVMKSAYYKNCLEVPGQAYNVKIINGEAAYPVGPQDNGKPISGLYYSVGLRVNGVEHYSGSDLDVNSWACSQNFTDENERQKIDIILKVFTDGTTRIPPGTYSINEFIATILSEGYSDTGTLVYLQSVDYINLATTLTVTASSCLVQTAKDISIEWSNLTPSQIKNKTAETKPAEIEVGCEDTNSHPMSVTVTGSNGYDDSANGVIKTSSEGLGLQLTWANNGQTIPLGQPMEFNPGTAGKLTQDFSINAKPVAIGSGNMSAGDFSSDVTVTFDYR